MTPPVRPRFGSVEDFVVRSLSRVRCPAQRGSIFYSIYAPSHIQFLYNFCILL